MDKKMLITLIVMVIASTAFAQVTVNLTPYNPPIQVSGSGGSFEYNIEVTNNDTSSANFDVWCMATLPDSSLFGPVLGPVNITVQAGASIDRDRTQNIPAGAPEGSYTFHAYAGEYPDVIWSSDSFPFEKLPPPPDTLWTQTLGGSDDDYGFSVQQTMGGGYIIAGFTNSYGAGGYDVYLIKTDSAGNEEWYQTFGGIDSDQGYSVQQTDDGGYIVTGDTWPYGPGWKDVYLVKTDGSGNELWSQTFGGSAADQGYSVQQTTEGGYIIAGWTFSYGPGYHAVYLIKTDVAGNEEWRQTFGGSYDDYGNCVQQTTDGGYIVAGFTESYGSGEEDVYLIKTDTLGNEEWSQTLGGSSQDYGYSVQQTTDGGYIVAGCTYSYGAGGSDVYLIKTDASGVEEWYQTFGGSNLDYGKSVQQTTEGGYIIAGLTGGYATPWGLFGQDVYLIKTNALGSEEWTQTFGGSEGDMGESVQQTTDGGYIVAGITYSFGAGSYDVWLIRLAPETAVNRLFGIPPEAEILVTPSDYSLSQNYPNPFNPTTTICFQLPMACWVKLEVFDIAGRAVGAQHAAPLHLVNGWRDAGVHEVTFDGSNLASGMYVYRLTAEPMSGSGPEGGLSSTTPTTMTGKMLLMK